MCRGEYANTHFLYLQFFFILFKIIWFIFILYLYLWRYNVEQNMNKAINLIKPRLPQFWQCNVSSSLFWSDYKTK